MTRHASPCAWIVRSTELSWTTYDQISASGNAGLPPGAMKGSPPGPHHSGRVTDDRQTDRQTTLQMLILVVVQVVQ